MFFSAILRQKNGDFVRVQGKPPVFPQRFIEKINLAEVLLQILPLSGRATSLCRIQILADFQQIQ